MINENEIQKLISVEKTAEILAVSLQTVRKLITEKELPATRIGNQYRIKETDINILIERNST